MEFIALSIPEVVLIKPLVRSDQRGYFFEVFQSQKFREHGMEIGIVQQNQSGSKKGILRGLHYQIQKPQGKLIRVIQGQVYDVAVDLRKSSPTFGKWVGQYLDDEQKLQLWIPPGFAHGFLVTSDWAEITYCTTDYYAPEHERTLLWNDPDIGIKWPLNGNLAPILSAKDAVGKLLKDTEVYG